MVLLALLITASVPTSDASVNPLDQAKDGSVQCYMPDDQRKTCRSIAAYVPTDNATYANKATVLISNKGPVILETVTPVKLKAGAICGSIREDDIRSGKLYIAHRLLATVEAAPLLARLAQSSKWLETIEICTTYTPTKDGMVAKVAYDGVYQEKSDQRVKWIRPSDGYSVVP